MKPGSTPTLTFKLKNKKDGSVFDTSLITDVRITFEQHHTNVLEKELKNCSIIENRISVSFTQEETLKFNQTVDVRTQIKMKLISGKVMYTDIFTIPIDEILCKEIL